ncbi:hypothetical protein BV25DRAFT_1823525 [Artomyces pyxidatus]|uniref:Uncharacterized protein n=1 Tax=Artomyces pyxidatus TaxID=48021 RepID=A0ACB8T5I8_9AGAM|nr:hypothetical protein BV25DRAFT_1823525 [Artomyces pyxidatus]
MLERNFLAHVRLGVLLMLLSCSVLLKVRLPGPDIPGHAPHNGSNTALASVEIVSAIVVICAGLWEYESGLRDMRDMRAFLAFSIPHLAIMAMVSAVVFATCVVLLASSSEIGP